MTTPTTQKHVMVPDTFMKGGAVSTKFAGAVGDELGAGIRSGFGIIGYKGKVWSTKYQGVETAMMREDGDGPRHSIEVVIVKASPHIAKIFYQDGFVDGSTAPPDCWSTNGLTPDPAAPKKQSATCAGCPKNAWGSKVTEAGKQTKACSDSKRLAIVPLNDLKNELMGGPMLLRVPAASLKDLKSYGDSLQAHGYPYFAVATRISFDSTEAFPKFVLTAMRPLTDDEADVILELQEDTRTVQILNAQVEAVHHEPQAAQVPTSPFEQPAAQPAAKPVTQPAVEVTAPAAQPAQPVANPPAEQAQVAGAPRKRRTKAEMEAAAAQLKAAREGTTAPAAPAAEPVQQSAPAEAAAPDDFDAQLDSLLPV